MSFLLPLKPSNKELYRSTIIHLNNAFLVWISLSLIRQFLILILEAILNHVLRATLILHSSPDHWNIYVHAAVTSWKHFQKLLSDWNSSLSKHLKHFAPISTICNRMNSTSRIFHFYSVILIYHHISSSFHEFMDFLRAAILISILLILC